MYCNHCGKEVSELDQNCPRCEGPLKQTQADARGRAANEKPKGEKKRGITVPTPVALVLGVLVIGGFIFLMHHKSTSQSMSDAAMNNHWGPQVVAVAKHFTCPCGNCADSLVVCNCPDPDGALETKRFIQKGLQEGKTPKQLVAAVARKYRLTPIKQ